MRVYLTIKQVCERLPVCKSLVYRLVAQGVIPSARLGDKILIPDDGLEALLSPAKVPDPAPKPEPKPRNSRGKAKRIQLW